MAALTKDIIYAGEVFLRDEDLPTEHYRCYMQHRGKSYYRAFFRRDFTSRDETRIACETYRIQTSDELGITKRRPVITKHQAQYLAGFFDGDGCVLLMPCFSGVKKSCQPSVVFTQAQKEGKPEVITFIETLYSGKYDTYQRTKVGKGCNVENTRRTHRVRVFSAYCVWFLQDVVLPHAIIKKPQAEVVLQTIQMEHGDRRLQMKSKLKKMKQLKSYRSIPVERADERVTDAYVAGLFDAEGCVATSKTLSVSVAQKSSPQLLQAILSKYGSPTSNQKLEYSVSLNGMWAEALVKSILPYTIVKTSQLKLVSERCLKRKLNEITPEYEDECVRELKRAKTK